ncbi:MAG: hypothetical protein ACRDO2_15110, partial [Nocardioidaceae bacterium]
GRPSPLSLSVDRVGVGVNADGGPAELVLGTGDVLRGDDPGTKEPTQGAANKGLLIQSSTTVEVNVDANDRPHDMFAVTHGSQRDELLRVQTDGDVGIGTAAPSGRLHVDGGRVTITDPGDGNVLLTLGSERAWVFKQTGSGAGTALELTALNPNNNNKNFLINTDGRVGIGTQAPKEKLDVEGSIRVSDDIVLVGADCAEEFDIDADSEIAPGTVMVITEGRRIRSSSGAYDHHVAGVVSGAGDARAGIVLGRTGKSGNRLPIALNGTTYCRVDASAHPVEVGDLLTTADRPGHAMCAVDRDKAFGAVIGKALGSLPAGMGVVPILVALQ